MDELDKIGSADKGLITQLIIITLPNLRSTNCTSPTPFPKSCLCNYQITCLHP